MTRTVETRIKGMAQKDSERVQHKSVTDRGHSRRHDSAIPHLNAQDHYRNRAKGRENKAPKGPFPVAPAS